MCVCVCLLFGGGGGGAGAEPVFSGGVYSVPGGAFDFDLGNSSQDVAYNIDVWANKTASQYAASGFNLSQAVTFALADEPGWYFPTVLNTQAWPPRVVNAWQTMLLNQSFTPADLGERNWSSVLPIGRGLATARNTTASRRLYYWSCRFFSLYSARHFASVTRAMETHFHAGMSMFANWNNFAGRFYVPGPLGNNPNKQSPDSGYGGHDWFDFGRARGTTCLWTEDWFDDGTVPHFNSITTCHPAVFDAAKTFLPPCTTFERTVCCGLLCHGSSWLRLAQLHDKV